MLSDGQALIRSEAAWALGMIEPREAVMALAQAVTTDQAGRVREQAAWALGMIESPEGARLSVVRAC